MRHLFLCLCFLSGAVLSYAQDIRFEAAVDSSTVALGEAVGLNLTFYGTQKAAAPKLDDLDGFKAAYLGPSTSISIVNGRMSSSITHRYSLVPLKTGALTIAPITVDVQGQSFTSTPIRITVVPAASRAAAAPPPQESALAPAVDEEKLRDHIFLTAQLDKKQAYVGEAVGLTFKLYVEGVSVQDVDYPKLNPRDATIGDFDKPRQYRDTLNGIAYDVVEFHTSVTGLKPGAITLGPAALSCNLLVQRPRRNRRAPFADDFFGSFFGDSVFDNMLGGYQTYPLKLESPAVPLKVSPLPQEGKPAGFSGALGDFTFTAEASPLTVKAGDPVTLKMTVTGAQNLDSVVCPVLSSREGFKVYDAQVRQEGDKKIFEQVLIPLTPDIKNIPRVDFSFFDTAAGRYTTLSRGPIALTVTPGMPTAAQVVEAGGNSAAARPRVVEKLGRDILYIKDEPGAFRRRNDYLYRNPLFWLWQLLVTAGFAVGVWYWARRRRIAGDYGYARRLRAPRLARKGIKNMERLLASGDQAAFFDAAFATARDYFSARFHLPGGTVSPAVVENILRSGGAAAPVIEKARFIFESCDTVRYAPSAAGQELRRQVYAAVREVIDQLEKYKI